MRVRTLALAALLAALAVIPACRSNTPGHLGAVSVRALDLPMTIVAKGAEGRACGNDTQQNLPAAIEDALIQNPPANAIVNIEVFKELRCVRVIGTAVRIAPAS